jgi:hypothetical protein
MQPEGAQLLGPGGKPKNDTKIEKSGPPVEFEAS